MKLVLTNDQKLTIDYRVRIAIKMIYLKAIFQKNIPLDECFHRASILNSILIRIGEIKNDH